MAEPAATPVVQLTILPTVPSPTATPTPEPIYLNLMWHQHQPMYFTDPQTGLITRPWVRVRATKDYYDMASILHGYPKVKTTVGLSPVLIEQLDDLANGARDLYWELGAKSAAQLNADEKRFILQRFFDADAVTTIQRYPRYQELLDMRAGTAPEEIESALRSFSEQDFRDLQVWFNLAWFAPNLLSQTPLQELVSKGRNFSENDKPALFNMALDIIRGVLPLHRRLQGSGQLEVAGAPYGHPVLPLIINTDLARAADPAADVPDRPFVYPQDAAEHLQRSIDVYQRHFGIAPQGLLPGGGAVSYQMVGPVSAAGYRWMASGEQVLARSLGIDGFTRGTQDAVEQADQLYRPYYVESTEGRRVAMVFGDTHLSGLAEREFDEMDGETRAQDLIDRVLRIRAQLDAGGDKGPHLVSIVIDGEDVWENDANEGGIFLNALYHKLSDAFDRGQIETVTPSAYLARFPEQRTLETLRPGAQFGSSFAAWIGEPEEAEAWNYLHRTRRFLEDFLAGRKPTEPGALDQAYTAMLRAEGSDWFMWYGADQDGDDDSYFDRGFRGLLAQVYDALGTPRPEFVDVPIIPAALVEPDQVLQAMITPTVDGQVGEGEWNQAGLLRAARGGPGEEGSLIEALYYGINPKDLVLRLDCAREWGGLASDDRPVRVGAYLRLPGANLATALSRPGPEDTRRTPLGMEASHLLEWTLMPNGTADAMLYAAEADGSWAAVAETRAARPASAALGTVVELSAPLMSMRGSRSLRAGDTIRMTLLATHNGRMLGQFPMGGVAQMDLPELPVARP
jgi:alpha-amylase/alpha-mannosidase (GH57 family)